MANHNTEHVRRILPLLVGEGEVSFTESITWSLPGKVKDFSEPEFSVLETKATVLDDEVCANFVVRQTTFYESEEKETVEKATTIHRFTKMIQVPGVKAGEQVEANAEAVLAGSCSKKEFTLRNQQATMLTGDCKLRVNYSVFTEQEVGFTKPVELDGEVLAEKIDIEAVCCRIKETTDLSLPFEFSSIPEGIGILNGRFINVKATPLYGWVKVEGEICAEVPNITENGRTLADTFVFPIKRFVEVPDARADMMVEITGRVELLACRCEKGEKAGIIRGLLHLEGNLRLIEALEVAVANRSHQSFHHKKKHHHHHHKPHCMEEVIGVNSSQTLIEREIVFSRPARGVREPVNAEVRNLQHEVIANKVIVRGVLDKEIFAIEADTGVVFAQDVTESFVHFVDLPGASPGMRAHVKARVEFVDVEVNPDGETARQVTIIDIHVKVTRHVKKEVVVSPDFPSKPDWPHYLKPKEKVYIVRSGDSVWKIANMFGVSMNAIIAANNLANPNLIFPGQQLIIPR